jgi:hypothetical protein
MGINVFYIAFLLCLEVDRTCSMRGAKRNACGIFLWRNPEGQRPLGRRRHRQEDDIKMDLREIGWCDMDSNHLAQKRDQWRALVNTIMKLRVP